MVVNETAVTSYDFLFGKYKGHLDFVDEWRLMGSPFPMLSIAILYLLFVLKIGPNFMKNRKPYSLKNILLMYNALQVAISAYLFYLCNEIMLPNGFVGKTCVLESEDNRRKISTAMYYYFLAKVTELFDTVFFILRKKDNQVTFLHVYHHAMMITTSWGILKYEPTYTSIFIRNINSFVHVVMYTYYGLSAYPSLAKYLWWKKYITAMQLVQFTIILYHFILTYMTSECRPSYALCLTIMFNTTFFLYLFGKFYIASYNKKKELKNSKAAHISERDTMKNGSNDVSYKDLVSPKDIDEFKKQ